MFQSVAYDGFDGRSELMRLAERGTSVLADEATRLTGELTVRWGYDPDRPNGLELGLRLDLPAASGTGARLIPLAAFADESELRSQLRRVWDLASGSYLDKRRVAWDELSREPAGV